MKRTLCWLVLLCACGSPAPSDRDASAADDAARPPRETPDAGDFVFQECRYGAGDCPGDLFCDADYPRGICTPRCSTDADCPPNARCIGPECRPRCTPGGNDCRDDMFCDPIDGVCEASCSSRHDATAQRCPTVGDACQASYCASQHGWVGGPIGAPCNRVQDCQFEACVPVGLAAWPGGMCVQHMRTPGWAAWQMPGRLPSGGCLDQHAIVPLYGSDGDIGACVPRCMVDTDCRDGYRCDHHVLYDAPEHTDGACTPWWCGNPRDSPCPADRTCVPIPGHPLGACYLTPP